MSTERRSSSKKDNIRKEATTSLTFDFAAFVVEHAFNYQDVHRATMCVSKEVLLLNFIKMNDVNSEINILTGKMSTFSHLRH